MKITVEFDDTDLNERVVTALADRLYMDVKAHVDTMFKDDIFTAMRTLSKREVEKVIATMTLPDGRTFQEYVSDFLKKHREGTHALRLQDLMSTTIRDLSRKWFDELVKPELAPLKEGLMKKLLVMALEELRD
jgi:hypothetical protein